MHISDSLFTCTKCFKMYKNVRVFKAAGSLCHQVFLRLYFYSLKAPMLIWCCVFEKCLLEQTEQNKEKPLFSLLPFVLQDNASVLEGYRKRWQEHLVRVSHKPNFWELWEPETVQTSTRRPVIRQSKVEIQKTGQACYKVSRKNEEHC